MCNYHTTQKSVTWLLSKMNENLCSHKNLYIKFHSSFVLYGLEPEITQMSFSRQMAKQLGQIHVMECCLAKEGNQLLIHAVWTDLWRSCQVENPGPRCETLCGGGGDLVAQSCPTLCSPTDCSPAGSSVRGIFQTKILDWVTISFFRGSSTPGIEPVSPALQADSLPTELPEKPLLLLFFSPSVQFSHAVLSDSL